MAKVLYIDYENVQAVDLSRIDTRELRICLFTGAAQSKVPTELAKSIHAIGDKLEWVTVDGNGPNALDFHIAYYLGVHTTQNPKEEYFLLSKDRGFDPLVSHLGKKRIHCKRIGSISEIEPTPDSTARAKKPPESDGSYAKILKNLGKIEPTKRPRNRKTLRQYMRTLAGKSISDEKLDQLLQRLLAEGVISDSSGRLTYQLTT
jgi:PIN domain